MELFLSEVIKKYGYTQQTVADKMGVSLQNVKNVIYNKNPTLSTLERIAEALGCDAREFFFNPKVSHEEIPISKPEKSENVVYTLINNKTGKKYKIVEIEE